MNNIETLQIIDPQPSFEYHKTLHIFSGRLHVLNELFFCFQNHNRWDTFRVLSANKRIVFEYEPIMIHCCEMFWKEHCACITCYTAKPLYLENIHKSGTSHHVDHEINHYRPQKCHYCNDELNRFRCRQISSIEMESCWNLSHSISKCGMSQYELIGRISFDYWPCWVQIIAWAMFILYVFFSFVLCV